MAAKDGKAFSDFDERTVMNGKKGKRGSPVEYVPEPNCGVAAGGSDA